MFCEDYPACGHTDGLPCDWTPNYAHIEAHAGCDHEAGYCQVQEALADLEDDEQEPMDDDEIESIPDLV